jgi:hypothetical protein
MSATIERAEALGGPLDARRDPDALAALWAMTPDERIAAMWRGELTLFQLSKWSSARLDEVPTIGGEFAYHVIRDPEWCEPSRPARRQPR